MGSWGHGVTGKHQNKRKKKKTGERFWWTGRVNEENRVSTPRVDKDDDEQRVVVDTRPTALLGGTTKTSLVHACNNNCHAQTKQKLTSLRDSQEPM